MQTKTYVIASTPRSGSTLLGNTLVATGGLGAPKEYCNPTHSRNWAAKRGSLLHKMMVGPLQVLAGRTWNDAQRIAHLEDVRAKTIDPQTGWFGLKIHFHHYAKWHVAVDRLEPSAWIFVRREDRVGQAVSWARALQTASWASHQKGHSPAIYSRRLIQRQLDAIERSEDGWNELFARRGITPLRIEHNEITRNLEGTVRTIFSTLGVPERPVVRASLERQAGGATKVWVERFSRETQHG